MGLFKKEKNCCCKVSSEKVAIPENKEDVKILGSGCNKCNEMAKNAAQALGDMGLPLNIEHVTDFSQIAAYGVMTTPALVYKNKVISYGKVLSAEEIKALLKKEIE